MSNPGLDRLFAGSLPQIYQAYLVPLIFEPYARDLVHRVSQRPVRRVLELAAGTGVVTRALASALPDSTPIVATDLNQAMLDQAASTGTSRPVDWRHADALRLPFQDREFDLVLCQFGAMFFSDKASAFREARRVLEPCGRFLFNVWDRIEENEFADEVTRAVAPIFPADPPRFLARVPHGYNDPATIQRDLVQGGFTTPPRIDTVTKWSQAESPRNPAVGFCQGTPVRNEIEARDASKLGEATEAATRAIATRFGTGEVKGRIQAHVISIDA